MKGLLRNFGSLLLAGVIVPLYALLLPLLSDDITQFLIPWLSEFSRRGPMAPLADNFSLKFLKKSSATFFAAASTRREPICASFPPTFAFTSYDSLV